MENMLLDISTMLNHPTIMLDPPTPQPQTIKMEDLVTAAPTPPPFMDTLAVPDTSTETETATAKPSTSDPTKPPPKKRKVSASVIEPSLSLSN
jgi:hypothetical protein